MILGEGLGMTLVNWAYKHNRITDKQYEEYMLQETEYPIPKLNKNE